MADESSVDLNELLTKSKKMRRSKIDTYWLKLPYIKFGTTPPPLTTTKPGNQRLNAVFQTPKHQTNLNIQEINYESIEKYLINLFKVSLGKTDIVYRRATQSAHSVCNWSWIGGAVFQVKCEVRDLQLKLVSYSRILQKKRALWEKDVECRERVVYR